MTVETHNSAPLKCWACTLDSRRQGSARDGRLSQSVLLIVCRHMIQKYGGSKRNHTHTVLSLYNKLTTLNTFIKITLYRSLEAWRKFRISYFLWGENYGYRVQTNVFKPCSRTLRNLVLVLINFGSIHIFCRHMLPHTVWNFRSYLWP